METMTIEYNDYEVELYKLQRLKKEITDSLGQGGDMHLKVLGDTLGVIDEILLVCNHRSLMRASNKRMEK